MSADDFEFEVGKRYKLSNWAADAWVEPIAVGDKMFFGRNQIGEEGSYEKVTMRGKWIEVEIQPEIPGQFFNVYVDGGLTSRAEADAAARPGRVGVVHVQTAGYGVDRVEFTRVKYEAPKGPSK